jgi:hypothetical protein
VTAADRPRRTHATSGPGRGKDRRDVACPPGKPDSRQRRENRWELDSEVRWVGGSEGDWLRHELAGVLRDLLGWAREDMNGGGDADGREGRAA